MSWEIRSPEDICSWWGDVGSVDTVSQLLSWNQAPGSLEDGSGSRLGHGKCGVLLEWPTQEEALCLGCTLTSLSGKVWEVSVADRSRVSVWEGDFGKCVFS